MKTTILFVCTGNICRSPMAEAVMRHKVAAAGLEQEIAVDSAGTDGWHAGEPPHRGTRAVLHAHEIATDGLVARAGDDGRAAPGDRRRCVGDRRQSDRLGRRNG
jgi:protein-tyrosine-phosphatase